MKNISVILIMVLLLLTKAGCTQSPDASSPPGYDFSKPAVYKMPPLLEEISGIALAQGNADTIFAEQDEEGRLFYFRPDDTEIKQARFSKKGDYEDIAVCKGLVIMLRSDGVFFTFPLNSIGNKDIGDASEQAGLLPPGEYESLYADEASGTLYLLCKNCPGGKSSQSITGYVFAIGAAGRLSLQNQFSIDEKPIAVLSGKEKSRLKPSGLAKNPLTHQWYIISSVNKMLVITDPQWKPINAYPLNPALFTQPEGIAFDKAGNLYISNEKGGGANGTILKFLYRKK